MAIKIALAGNPNCGKTTMFNALTGANQYVGNWPGVTVEKKEGKLKSKKTKEEVIVTDLPGIYSMSPYTLEEVVSRDYVLKENPDVIIDLVDATNIERNLYLTTQLIETGVPVVIALNMADLLAKRGIKIDVKRLSMLLDCPIIETSALKGEGLDKLIDEAVKVAKKSEIDLPKDIFSAELEGAVAEVKSVLPSSVSEEKKRWYAVKFLENDSKVVESMKLSGAAAQTVEAQRKALEKKHDDDMESIVTDERYKFIQKIVSTTVQKGKEKLTTSDKIDRIVTNRFLGIPIFMLVMWIVYYVSVTTVGTFVTDWTNDVLFGEIIPPAVESALEAVRSGKNPELTTREKHTRECFVVAEEGADLARIENEIKTMPNYFDEYDTTVHFISEEELKRDHSGIPHGGFVIRTGKTGWNDENSHVIEYSLKLDSNPEFTSSVIIAYARAAYRMNQEGQNGCKTVFDVAPAYLSALSGEELRKHLL